MYIVLAILLLAILIVVHEFGHFMAARLMKIDVTEFSIGFGPRLLGWNSRKYETKFSVRAIPLGGYCAFYGEDDRKGITKDDPRAFPNHNVWKRMFVILMGPVMNFVLAFLVAVAVMWIAGKVPEQINMHIQRIEADGAAEEAGLQEDDIITAVNGETILYDSGKQSLVDGWQEGDPPIQLTVLRGEETLEIGVTPKQNEKDGKMRIGIEYIREPVTTRPVGFLEGITAGWETCVDCGGAILEALKQLVTTGQGLEETSGVVGIVATVSTITREEGFIRYVELMIIISVNLGLMNLLPIPGLDGSRLVFGIIEAIRGKPIPQEKEAMVHLAGMVLLFGLMIFFTYKDISRLIIGP